MLDGLEHSGSQSLQESEGKGIFSMIILIDDNVDVLHGDMSTLKFKILFVILLT